MPTINESLKDMRKEEYEENGEVWDDEIVCPHCFCQFSDSWEYDLNHTPEEDREVSCQKCDEKFICMVEITVRYRSTRKP